MRSVLILMNRPSIVVFAYSEPGYTCLYAIIEAIAIIFAVQTKICTAKNKKENLHEIANYTWGKCWRI